MPKEKSTSPHKSEPEDRYRDIDSLMDKGLRSADITHALVHRYGISRRQAERDIQVVKGRRGQYLLLSNALELRAEHYSKLGHIYQSSLKKDDYQTALKALALQEELSSKQDILKGETHATVSTTSQTLPEELEKLLEELRADPLGE